MKAPPGSTKAASSTDSTIAARGAWPDLAGVAVRFRANFCVDGRYPDGTLVKLCRLRYGGSARTWGFAIYRASHNDYEDYYLPNGMTAQKTLDRACGLYLTDPVRMAPGYTDELTRGTASRGQF